MHRLCITIFLTTYSLLCINNSLFCINSYTSNDTDNIDKSKIDISLLTDMEYIDKNLAANNGDYAITFKVYVINKTDNDLMIPDPDDNLIFYVQFRSTVDKDYLKDKSYPTIFFNSLVFPDSERILLKAHSYIVKDFTYLIPKDALKELFISNDYNIFQGFCEYIKLIKSNKVNIPMIKNHGASGSKTPAMD